jgi:hypothetical protein
MYRDFKIITITPLGRRKYIELLFPYILQNKRIIDKHIFWVNTKNQDDINYVEDLVSKYPKIFAIEYGVKNKGKKFVNDLYLNCNDIKTIYIKINDDICWINSDAILNLLEFRINNPNFFLIYPIVMNTGINVGLYQAMGHIPIYLTGEWPWDYRHNFDLSKFDGITGQILHEVLLKKIQKKQLNDLVIERYVLSDYECVPEHCVCWFGKDFLYLNEKKSLYEPNFLSQIESESRNKYSCLCGSSLMSHFSYSSQEEYLLEQTFLYNEYKKLSNGDKL